MVFPGTWVSSLTCFKESLTWINEKPVSNELNKKPDDFDKFSVLIKD